MKTSTFLKLYLFFLLLALSVAVSANVHDSTFCLKLKGKLDHKLSAGESYTIDLIHCNTVVDSKVLTNSNFDLFLKENTWYAVRVSKSGCVPKLISICTTVPLQCRNYFYELNFTLEELISDNEAEFLDKETLDFPVAIFTFNNKLRRFDYVPEYTTNIRKHLSLPLVGSSAVQTNRR